MLAKVLDFSAPTLRDIAAQAGISYSSIRQYRKAKRTPPPAVIRRLAAVLRTRGEKLQALAAELDKRLGSER
jgi:transcriptional regulator with XRE-family HTH domain